MWKHLEDTKLTNKRHSYMHALKPIIADTLELVHSKVQAAIIENGMWMTSENGGLVRARRRGQKRKPQEEGMSGSREPSACPPASVLHGLATRGFPATRLDMSAVVDISHVVRSCRQTRPTLFCLGGLFSTWNLYMGARA